MPTPHHRLVPAQTATAQHPTDRLEAGHHSAVICGFVGVHSQKATLFGIVQRHFAKSNSGSNGREHASSLSMGREGARSPRRRLDSMRVGSLCCVALMDWCVMET
jgi:hypothetical protein